MNRGGDIDGKVVYWTGGICGLILGIAYLIIVALYAPIGAPPVKVDALLRYLAAIRPDGGGLSGSQY